MCLYFEREVSVMPETIFMAVENDGFELPVYVGDSQVEVEMALGLYRGAVHTAIKNKGVVKSPKLNMYLRFYPISTAMTM